MGSSMKMTLQIHLTLPRDADKLAAIERIMDKHSEASKPEPKRPRRNVGGAGKAYGTVDHDGAARVGWLS